MFTNKVFSCLRIETMQPSMEALYKIAREKKTINSPAAVARVMNVTQQRMKNWESRGISKEGAMKAQAIFGLDANALLKADTANLPANEIGKKHTKKTPGTTPINEDRERVVGYINPSTITDTFILTAIEILRSLKKSQREGAVANLRLYVSQLSPPRDGQALQMADKKEGAA